MKTLYILRHAKSSWAIEGIDDSDRPLNKKGINDAYHKAQILASKKVSIDLLITSHAFRAITTAIIIAKQLNYLFDRMVINPQMYGTDVKTTLQILENVNSNVTSLMMVGHNTTLTEFSNCLTHDKIEEIPTSGLVCIEFDSVDWRNLGKGTIKYVEFSKT